MAYAQKVIESLPFPEIEVLPIVTEGDAKHNQPIHEMWGKGVFVSEIEKHLIDKTKDRHTRIFHSHNELISAGYTNASDIDLMATKWFNKTNKVGLIFH